MKMKLLLLTLGSAMLTAMVVTSAFYQKKQFYPSVIYMTKSSISMAALYLQAFVIVILISKLLGKIFFGQLRPAEVEHLIERMWYAITETCLAFTVFRDDFSSKFVAMFTILLFFKCFHWLAEDRVDFMERSPVIPLKFHIRIIGLILLLSSIDYMFIIYAYRVTVDKGPSSQLVFGFEYTILKLGLLVILCRYVLHTIDSRRETPWDQKATFMLYIDLISNFLKLLLYLLFLFLMIKVHTLPLFIIRPVYLSLRSFKKSVQDLILSRRAIHYMNTIFTNATESDLTSTDNICIICREEMVAAPLNARDQNTTNVPKCLPCGHIFHCSCLKTWFQRQQTCPTCRMDILRNVQLNNPRGGVPAGDQRRQAQSSSDTRMTPPGNSGNSQTGNVGVSESQIPSSPLSSANVPHFPPGPFPWMFPPPPPPPMPDNGNQQPDSSNNTAANVLPPLFSPFLLPGMPIFTRSMPELSSQDLAKMSDEELTLLEKQGREGIEFRLQTIQRIQTLLDAAVLQMNAYMISVRNMSSIGEIKSPLLDPVNSTDKIVKIDRGEKPTSADISSTDQEEQNSPIVPSDSTTKQVADAVSISSLDVGANDEKINEELHKIRDLRLRKFQSQSSETTDQQPQINDP